MIERWKHTDMVCDECGSPIVMDVFKEEFYCLKCGLVDEGELSCID